MRCRIIAMILTGALCLAATEPALAGRRDPKTPPRGVKVTTSGATVRYTVNRAGKPRTPGRVRVNPGSVTCRRWTTIETLVSGPPEKPVTTTITHYWKQCFSTVTGRPTGPAREYDPGGGGVPAAEEVWTAVVPDPVIQRENGVRFVTQRTAWVWLPPEYFRGITVDLRSSTGELRSGGATARAVQVLVNPGWGGAGTSVDCTVEAAFPYDRGRPFWDQESCGLWYMKSSLDESGGVYRATATVVWEVNAVIDGEPADTATVVTDGQAAFRVEELQALVTCVGGSPSSCPADRSGTR